MSTFVYAPSVEIHIATAAHGIIDVSLDIVRGTVNRNTGVNLSSMDFEIINPSRKYEGMFSPMDRVVVYLRRTRRLLIFSGYLDVVPVFSATLTTVHLSATDTLKRLQQFLWDPHSDASNALLLNPPGNSRVTGDGGVAERTKILLNKVAGWPTKQIHISAIPGNWFSKIQGVAQELVDEATKNAAMAAVGNGATLEGNNPLTQGAANIPGIGPGTGILPSQSGRCTNFGGPTDYGAHGPLELRGDQYPNYENLWYCAMRWPYLTMGPNHGDTPRQTKGIDYGAVREWWKRRKILVVNPLTHKAVCLEAADWGPSTWTGNNIDVSPEAMQHLCGQANASIDNVNIAFAPAGTALGPVNLSPSTSAQVGSTLAGAGVSGWGNPRDAGFEATYLTRITAGGISVTVAKQAAAQYTGFLNELSAIVTLNPGDCGGYRDANHPGTGIPQGSLSNHAYGAAVDLNVSQNPFYYATYGTHAFPDDIVRTLAHKWGLWWGGDYHSRKDYMHFEVAGAPVTPTEANQYILSGGVPSAAGAAAAAAAAGSPGSSASIPGTTDMPLTVNSLFNFFEYLGQADFSGKLLPGIRALMNDEPILNTVDSYMTAALRDYCSAPNGDFMAWFPDYYGHYGTAGKIIVSDVEIMQPFTIAWGDENLKTHFFVMGSSYDRVSPDGMGGDASQINQELGTAGIASVEMPQLMHALFNLDAKVFANQGRNFLNRYGARVVTEYMNNIHGHQQEFFFAVYRFMLNWSSQYYATVEFTFLPEIYPGMLLVFPRYGLQAYVQAVNHSFDLSTGGGPPAFTTRANLTAWSTIGSAKQAIKGLPKGASL